MSKRTAEIILYRIEQNHLWDALCLLNSSRWRTLPGGETFWFPIYHWLLRKCS